MMETRVAECLLLFYPFTFTFVTLILPDPLSGYPDCRDRISGGAPEPKNEVINYDTNIRNLEAFSN
jgi:hypothetical protein